jgi:adenylate cyclase
MPTDAVWRPAPVIAWLARDAWRVNDSRKLLDELCARLIADGVPLWRLNAAFRTLHPELFADSFTWWRGARTTYETASHEQTKTIGFTRSPLVEVARTRRMIRRRLVDPSETLEFPVLADLRAKGGTDYVALPLEFTDGSLGFISLATDSPDGFSDAHLALCEDLRLVLARLAEAITIRSVAARLLDTYVGHDAGEHILRGQILRGSGDSLDAALWFCDLRGFTPLTGSLPRDELIALLNTYFDRMGEPVQRHGGEILKFIGDAMLAIFPTHEKSPGLACTAAFAAANEAIAAMAGLNGERRERGQPALGFGIALHIGEVMYGNIGTKNRLDFTVIGPAVNLVNRISGLCRELDRSLLVSEKFAAELSQQLVPLGSFNLRGFAEAQNIHGLGAEGLAHPRAG